MRDFQRQKIYDSEREFRRKYKSEIQYYKNLKEVQVFINIILSNQWFKKYGIKNIYTYRSSQSTAYGWLEDGNIIGMKLPKWAKNQLTILHETAHGVCDKLFSGCDDIACHGIEYMYIYLDLIYHFLGKSAFVNMCTLLTKNKVKYSFATLLSTSPYQSKKGPIPPIYCKTPDEVNKFFS